MVFVRLGQEFSYQGNKSLSPGQPTERDKPEIYNCIQSAELNNFLFQNANLDSRSMPKSNDPARKINGMWL